MVSATSKFSFLAASFEGMVDYERAVAKRKRQLFRNLFDLLPKSGPVVSYHLLAQDFLCFFFFWGGGGDSSIAWFMKCEHFRLLVFEAVAIFFGDANHFPKTKQRFFCSYLCVQEPKSISGNRCHDWPCHSPILISFTMQPINTSLWVQRGCGQGMDGGNGPRILMSFLCRSWRLALEAFRTLCTWVLKMHHRIWTSSEWIQMHLGEVKVVALFLVPTDNSESHGDAKESRR